jgi:DNA-binding transcriptional MerR regulator
MTVRLLQIGEVAERVGLSLRTVRYYEEMGLLTPADRTEGGFRLFSEDQVERLLLIKQMKPLGFTVQEIRALLDAHDVLSDPEAADEARAEAAQAMSGFAAVAAERVDALREQLRRAEDFAEQLRRETRRTGPAVTRG